MPRTIEGHYLANSFFCQIEIIFDIKTCLVFLKFRAENSQNRVWTSLEVPKFLPIFSKLL